MQIEILQNSLPNVVRSMLSVFTLIDLYQRHNQSQWLHSNKVHSKDHSQQAWYRLETQMLTGVITGQLVETDTGLEAYIVSTTT